MHKLQLKKPIKAHGEELTELTFTELTAGMLRRFTKDMSEEQKVLLTIECSANIPASSVDQLSMADFKGAADIIAGFTQSGTTN